MLCMEFGKLLEYRTKMECSLVGLFGCCEHATRMYLSIWNYG